MASARPVLETAEIGRILTRIAHEVLERNHGPEDLVLLGIPTRGTELARRVAERLVAAEPGAGPVEDLWGSLDVTMHRDDLRRRPVRALGRTSVPSRGVDDRVVVLVDDVLASGRTVRAALDALSDLGRPRAVRLAVLVDRGHRQLPIRADHVGKNLPTAADEQVRVLLREVDGVDDAVVIRGPEDRRPPGTGADGRGAGGGAR